MKLNKYIKINTVALLASVGLFSCSDDLEVKQAAVEDGMLEIRFDVPDAEVVRTRVQSREENSINQMKLYFFSVDGNNLYAEEDIDPSWLHDNKLTIKLPEQGKTNPMTLYAVVNGNSFLQGIVNPTVTKIENRVATGPISLQNGLVMSGESVNIGAKATAVNITLNRVVSKVSMEFEDNLKEKFSLVGFDVEMAAQGAFIGAGTNNSMWFYSAVGETFNAQLTNGVCDTYVYPSKGKKSNASNPVFVVMRAKYPVMNGKDYYYRLDLVKDGEGLDIEPNHEYQLVIRDINKMGYPTAAEAAKNPETDGVDYEIHDHAKNVMSMTSDGIRELGVTGQVYMSGNVESNFTVKCFSKADSNDVNEKVEERIYPTITVKEGSDWLQVLNSEQPEMQSGTSADTSGEQHTDDPGTRWIYRLGLVDNAKIYSDKTAVIDVEWMGLSRSVTVYYEASFNADEACAVTLNYKQNGNVAQASAADYWSFLSTTVKGIDKESMADGKVRNEGLHFPMPYGVNNQWTYDYDIDFTKSNDSSNPIKNITISTSGDSFFNVANLDWVYNTTGYKGTLKLKSPKANDFTYATGAITFHIVYNDNSERNITMDLYHTGFFHTDNTMSVGCLYYEVVDLGGKYWLDRNIGATSNMMFIDNADNTNAGNEKARGLFYKIADIGNDYNDPTPKYSTICPPGYEVPNSTDWSALRLSPNFTSSIINDGLTSYVGTYYISNEAKIGKVYFPKGRFYNQNSPLGSGALMKHESDVNSGDGGSAYYWTSTVASGLEKDEIGNWYRALYMNGSSNTFINGSIKYHMMNVRCIATYSHSSEVKNAIDFNVKGATHVYLYSLDANQNKSGIFSFPGKAIGSQSAVDNLDYSKDNSYLHFSYTSTIPAKELKVFFAYVKDNGEIKIISKNNSQTVGDAEGWDVIVGYNYFFNLEDNFKPIPSTSGEFPWPATGASSGNNGGGGQTGGSFIAGKKMTIYWPQYVLGVNMYKIYMWDDNGTKLFGEFPGATNDGWFDKSQTGNPYGSTNEAYKKEFTLSNTYNKLNAIVADESGNKTPDIEISYKNITNCTITEDAGGYKVVLKNLSKQ